MSMAAEYRQKAAELSAQASDEPTRGAQLLNLAMAYLRLAEQAEKNAATDLVYETPSSQPQAQQQQQEQPEKKQHD